jgi:serine/threonine-protein kinase
VDTGRLSESLAGRYRVERELGAGGMATVYLARDLRHDRQVALKVVKPEIVKTIGSDRFLDEIRTTANLRHPHILPLFDSGAVDDAPFYVMPYIEGESLRARLRRETRLPIADAVQMLCELADALTHAHAQGIVHRDIKPDNVLLSGRHVFLADFGIARALEGMAPGDRTMTATSAIVGTPTYLAPEQIAGQSHIDQRADVYAFGVMAYEMLAGEPPFTGATPAVVMSAHLTASPKPPGAVRPDVPADLAAIVMKCLEKKPEDRWQSVGDLLVGLEALSTGTYPATGASRTGGRAAVAAGALLVVLAGIVAGWMLLRARDAPITVGALRHLTRDSGLELDPAISPDGRTLAYVAGAPGKRRVYVRQLDGPRAIALTEPDVAESQRHPSWSPDGSRIVFQAGRQGIGVRTEIRTGALYVVPALGGVPTVLVPPGNGGVALTPAWSPDGLHVAYCTDNGIYVIPAAGGPARRIVESQGTSHSPSWSPDGTRLAYVAGGFYFSLGEDMLGNTETSSMHIVNVATGTDQAVTSGQWLDLSPQWTPDGRAVLFVSTRNGGRDVYRQRLSRSDTPDGDAERVTSGLGAHSISLSPKGNVLAYSALVFRANIWSLPIPDRGTVSASQAIQVTSGSEKTEKMIVSRDGQWLAYDSDRSGSADVWKARIGGGEPEQVTRDPGNEFANDWSPDGSEIAFHAIRTGTARDLLSVKADGTATSVIVATRFEEQHASWSPDGNSVAFSSTPLRREQYNVYVVTRPNRDAPWGKARQLTTGTGMDPKWSPDGRLIAFPRAGEIRVIQPDGGAERVVVPRPAHSDEPVAQYAIWSPDSRTLYFKAAADERRATIWAVPAAGGAPRLLVTFDDPQRPSLRREFATDGKRFFFTIAQDESDIWVADVR